ncbi:MAG TPA: hypothetical protein VNU72_05395, partial [Puia sp.]|nr:hypothetical protein [Puia sp.]
MRIFFIRTILPHNFRLRHILFLTLLCGLPFLPLLSRAQLYPGFDGHEYIGLLRIGFTQHDIRPGDTPVVSGFRLVYRSPEAGLFNRWDMWYRDYDSVAVISIRGTIGNTASWLEN